MDGLLLLEDGTEVWGIGFGAERSILGELVFNTSMTGYQEALTDPSYSGQILMMTYPLIGNYGISPQGWESDRVQVRGFVVRECCDHPHHRYSKQSLDEFLKDANVPGIQGIDTRALTIKTREKGTQKSVIISKQNISQADIDEAKGMLETEPMPSDTNLVGGVSNPKVIYHRSPSKKHVLLFDCGVKYSIIKYLWKRSSVIQVPYDFPVEKVRELDPDLILVSNGPGDPDHPRMQETTIPAIRNLKDEYPMTGICLGHQLISLAFGGSTYKLKFGHRGSNHPVKDMVSGTVAITSQNHGFAVDPEEPGEGLTVTRMNLNDNTVEGVRHKELPIMCVQYHPEASPGPMDSLPIFDEYLSMARKDGIGKSPEELLKQIDELVSPTETDEVAGRLD